MEALSSQSSIASVSDKQPSGDAVRFSIIFWASVAFLVAWRRSKFIVIERR